MPAAAGPPRCDMRGIRRRGRRSGACGGVTPSPVPHDRDRRGRRGGRARAAPQGIRGEALSGYTLPLGVNERHAICCVSSLHTMRSPATRGRHRRRVGLQCTRTVCSSVLSAHPDAFGGERSLFSSDACPLTPPMLLHGRTYSTHTYGQYSVSGVCLSPRFAEREHDMLDVLLHCM